MTSLKLYELSAQFAALEALASSEDIAPEVIRDTLDGVEAEFDAKCVAVACYIANLDTVAKAKAARAKEMLLGAERIAERSDSLRQYLQFHMLAANRKRVESDLFDIVLVNNPPSVIIDDESKVPAAFMRTPEPPPPPKARPDLKAIGAAFKAGQDVAGCHPHQGQRVEIKV